MEHMVHVYYSKGHHAPSALSLRVGCRWRRERGGLSLCARKSADSLELLRPLFPSVARHSDGGAHADTVDCKALSPVAQAKGDGIGNGSSTLWPRLHFTQTMAGGAPRHLRKRAIMATRVAWRQGGPSRMHRLGQAVQWTVRLRKAWLTCEERPRPADDWVMFPSFHVGLWVRCV